MTRLIYKRAESSQSNHSGKMSSSEEQILHLKRLLVTLKQQYEKSLQEISQQLQTEKSQKQALQKDLERVRVELHEVQNHHEEEQDALKHQQASLKDLLKKFQDELKQYRDQQASHLYSHADVISGQKRIEELESLVSYLREKIDGSHSENEKIKEELEATQKKNKLLQAELANHQHTHQRKLDDLQDSLAFYEQGREGSEGFSQLIEANQVRQELILIKQALLQGSNETKALEARYIEVLTEKAVYESQIKQLQQQLEHQSSNFIALNEKLEEIEKEKKQSEMLLREKELEINKSQDQRQQLEFRIQKLEEVACKLQKLQERYEQLREESEQISERLEEALDVRIKAELELNHMHTILKEQEEHLEKQGQQLNQLSQEKENSQLDIQQLRTLFEESEARLKIAQQHLAKKVKEVALLNERVEEQQADLAEYQQIIDTSKTQISHLQANIELYQKQEKRLQEQLHEALKSTESQVAKWEEKYFCMYDKWQESEERIRELKKFEERHHQMQSLISNLGTFMGSSLVNHTSLFSQTSDIEKSMRSSSFESVNDPSVLSSNSKVDYATEEKFDLFSTRQHLDKFKNNLFS